jgi:hypothetical protein
VKGKEIQAGDSGRGRGTFEGLVLVGVFVPVLAVMRRETKVSGEARWLTRVAFTIREQRLERRNVWSRR